MNSLQSLIHSNTVRLLAVLLLGTLPGLLTGCGSDSPETAVHSPKPEAPAPQKAASYTADFNDAATAREGWEGRVRPDAATAFRGGGSLLLEKGGETLRADVKSTGPRFGLAPGNWEVRYATRTEMDSMDNSYKGVLALEFLDGDGRVLERKVLAEPFRQSSWKPAAARVTAPDGTVAARFTADIEKETTGRFWIDELAVRPGPELATDDRIQRMMISHAQLGNLLYPDDPRRLDIELWASEELPPEQLKVHARVHDYWGQEQGAPLEVRLQKTGTGEGRIVYTGQADLTALPLETGRYYELRTRIDRGEAVPFTDFNSFAILPEAPANSYPPREVPFTARTWDNRFAEYVRLTHRIGIRICGVWGRMEADPARVEAPQIDLVHDLGMGYLTGSPAHGVEQRTVELNEEKLRQGVRNFFAKYGEIKPAYVNLGNEPHAHGEQVKTDIEAYRIVYTEIKKIDPDIFVVGSSFGTQEDYFKHGAGEWLDAYDFHTYESAEHLRDILEITYPALFKKYGFEKPIWSTEIGLNSQGMSRLAVARSVYRKFAYFFSAGGANVSWFGFLYPDEKGDREETGPQAHNMFFCRYAKYGPRLDAIANYHGINGIGTKKFIQTQTYPENVSAFLFRDREGKALQIWFKEGERQDVFVPLPETGTVEVVRIDGSRRTLQAGGKGITLSVDEDPILLHYDGPAPLPAKLGEPAVRLASAPHTIVRGVPATVKVTLEQATAGEVDLRPGSTEWPVEKSVTERENGQTEVAFTFTVPEDSAASEADLTVGVRNPNGSERGQIYVRPMVAGAVTGQLMPVPATPDGDVAAKMVIRNNSPREQVLDWSMELTGQRTMKDGAMKDIDAPEAYFDEVPSGRVTVAAGETVEVKVPLANADLHAVYHAVGRLRDSSGRVTVDERPLAGFYGVPRAGTAPVIDGRLDDPAWAAAPVRRLDQPNEFYAYERFDGSAPADWSGPEDLSAEIRYLWDDEFLYVSAVVKDDEAAPPVEGVMIWAQDGLQFLVDPMRASGRKAGKYDYALGRGRQGIQAWSYLSADTGAPTGEVKDFRIAIRDAGPGTAGLTYEVAIPWSRLAPFQPGPGGNLGLTLLVNEGDGRGRDSYMMWFANASTKDVVTVADLILLDGEEGAQP